MFSRIVRYWRVFGTGLSFVAVGIGGVFVFPLLNIVIRSRQRRTVVNVTPVLIRCAPPMLVKGEKWWRLPSSPSRYVIEVQEDIDIRPFIAEAGSSVLAARRFTDYLQDYFTQEKICHGIG